LGLKFNPCTLIGSGFLAVFNENADTVDSAEEYLGFSSGS